jgi:enoyl-CoA hydratase/carnithine racemase
MSQREISSKPAQLWLTLTSLKKVVISAVNGYALAGGTGLASCCDVTIAADDAVFGLPEINVGLWPMTIAPAMMRMVPSIKKCLEIFLTGDRLSAQEAEGLGLVNRVVPADKLEETVMEFARKLASKSPKTMQAGKKSFYTMLDMEYGTAMEYAIEMISALAISEDGREGQKAFVEKRKPKWAKLS